MVLKLWSDIWTPLFAQNTHFWPLFDSPSAQLSWDRRFCGWFVIRGLGPTSTPKVSPIEAILGLQILLFLHFLTFLLEISANQVAMTSFLKMSTKDLKSKPKTLQNRIIKETFAKNRMSKAFSVQKKIGSGRTDRQTDTQIFLLIIRRRVFWIFEVAKNCFWGVTLSSKVLWNRFC